MEERKTAMGLVEGRRLKRNRLTSAKQFRVTVDFIVMMMELTLKTPKFSRNHWKVQTVPGGLAGGLLLLWRWCYLQATAWLYRFMFSYRWKRLVALNKLIGTGMPSQHIKIANKSLFLYDFASTKVILREQVLFKADSDGSRDSMWVYATATTLWTDSVRVRWLKITPISLLKLSASPWKMFIEYCTCGRTPCQAHGISLKCVTCVELARLFMVDDRQRLITLHVF